MTALFLKEMRGLGVYWIAGIAVVATIVLDDGPWGAWCQWVLPTFGNAEPLMGIGMAGGFLLGFVTFVAEELGRTYEYLVHRPVGLARIVAAKGLACALVLVSWLLVPLALQLLVHGTRDPGRHLYELGRVWVFLAFWTLSLSACGAGCLVGTLRAAPLFRLAIAAWLGLALLAMTWQLLSPASGQTSAALFAACHLAVALLLGAATWWTLREGADPDLPASPRRAALTGVTLGVALVTAGGLGIAELQNEVLGGLYRLYPSLARTSDDQVVLQRWLRHQGVVRHDAQHLAVPGTAEAGPGTRYLWHPDRRARARRNDPAQAFERWRGVVMDPTGLLGQNAVVPGLAVRDARYLSVEILIDRQDRRVRAYLRADSRQGAPSRALILGRPPQNEPFRGEVLVQRTDDHELVLVDLGDRTIWRLDGNDLDGGFQALALPDGDTFVEPVDLDPTARQRVWPADRYQAFLLRGERGSYARIDGKMLALPDTVKPQRLGDEPPVRVVDDDLVAPVVEVLHEDGHALGGHAYGLYTLPEKAHGALLYALSLLRAPALQAASFCFASDGQDFRTSLERGAGDLLDPLLAGRRRPLLLLGNLLVGLAGAILASRRLAKLGAPRCRRRLWAGFVLIGGPLAAIAQVVLERRRAWRPTPVTATAEPRLLLPPVA